MASDPEITATYAWLPIMIVSIIFDSIEGSLDLVVVMTADIGGGEESG